jgi:hypothetical protein
VAGTPARAPNANAKLYALLGFALVAGGLGFILAPASTFAGVFGQTAAAPPAAVSMMLWRVLGAVDAALAGGVAYTLKEGAAFNDLSETKFKWLNFALLATGAVHVVILAPLAQGQGGPAAPALLALWGAASAFCLLLLALFWREKELLTTRRPSKHRHQLTPNPSQRHSQYHTHTTALLGGVNSFA